MDATIVNKRNHIARSATIGGRATIFFVVDKLKVATIHQSKKRYGGATILVGSATIFQSFEDVHPKWTLRNDPEYRARKQVADMEGHVVACLDPEYREQENEQ